MPTTTLPDMTRAVDDEFVETWYEIRAEAIDNILDATVISAALRDAGCFKTQVGGVYITRTIRYGEKTAVGFGKGDVLPADEEPLETMAWWPWKYFTVEVTRSLIDDQVNNGPSKIKDYVSKRLEAAREALVQKIEDILGQEYCHPDNDSAVTAVDAKDPYSLFDYVPDLNATNYFAQNASVSYTYGNLSRYSLENPWWQHRDYTDAVTVDLTTEPNALDIKDGPCALTIYDDMKNAFNTTTNNLQKPNLIIMNQATYELYESFVDSKDQLIKDATTRLADLGYDVLRFKGVPVIWTDKLNNVAGSAVTYQLLMINTDFLDIIYDPNLWFDMSEWRTPARQMERVSYISSSMQVVGYQPRRNCRMRWSA